MENELLGEANTDKEKATAIVHLRQDVLPWGRTEGARFSRHLQFKISRTRIFSTGRLGDLRAILSKITGER